MIILKYQNLEKLGHVLQRQKKPVISIFFFTIVLPLCCVIYGGVIRQICFRPSSADKHTVHRKKNQYMCHSFKTVY